MSRPMILMDGEWRYLDGAKVPNGERPPHVDRMSHIPESVPEVRWPPGAGIIISAVVTMAAVALMLL